MFVDFDTVTVVTDAVFNLQSISFMTCRIISTAIKLPTRIFLKI